MRNRESAAIGAVYGVTLGPIVVLAYLMATTIEMDIVALLLWPFVFPIVAIVDTVFSLTESNANPIGPFFPLGVAAGFYGLIGAVAGNVFAKKRHRPEGVCQCGYNPTGNESGVCPECGMKIEAP